MYGKNDSVFSRFPKYSAWKSNVDMISYSISNVDSGMNNQIDINVHSSTTVNPILKLSVSLSTQFLQKYISWLTKSYKTSIEAGLSSESAWCLATKLGECVFRTLQESSIQIRSGEFFRHEGPKTNFLCYLANGGGNSWRDARAYDERLQKSFIRQ